MANLAIKGHATRGSEVIALLEMIGGINKDEYVGNRKFVYYFIENNYIDWCHERIPESDFICFTLEEFLEKFPYKIGDRVSSKYLKNYKIEKMEWEGTNNRVIYKLQGMGWYAVNELQPYKEETMDRKYNVEEYLKVWEETKKGLEVVVNDNFELKEDSGKFYIIKKQSKYPKTYEECCEVLIPDCVEFNVILNGYNGELLEKLGQLLICRDAYWKITGKQMGLGKPWEPNWNESSPKYTITVIEDKLVKNFALTQNYILAFPTEEMRDAFYENFKELIEICKELL